jgi:hypothetical protein
MAGPLFSVGDRVKLHDELAKQFDKKSRRKTSCWSNRKGIITSLNSHTITIRWDDRASVDQWPLKALERIHE